VKHLENKVALVTGASAGIGKSTALALAAAKMKVVLVARSRDKLEKVASEIKASGREAMAIPTDLRTPKQIEKAFGTVRKIWGGVDVLVNSAGLGRIAPLMSGDTEALREMLEVNVLGLAVATREAVQDMQRRQIAGHIIHISSMSAYRVQGDNGMYGATKHAVRAMTEGLRLELRAAASPIRVSSISPADTHSDFMTAMYTGKEAAKKAAPPYRIMDAEDVASAVINVLSQPGHVEIHDILLRSVEQPD
jgi:17beta-estradiol 17-dehydrogenase / 3beta-hydroxysteroid 3-dehydrogenase